MTDLHMSPKKSTTGFTFLVVIGIIVLAVTFMLHFLPWFDKIFEVRSEVDLSVKINDQATGMVSLLKSKTGDLSYFDALVYELESLPTGSIGNDISGLANAMDLKIILWDRLGKEKKSYGDRKREDDSDIIRIDIPRPGGKISKIGFVTDLTEYDLKKFYGIKRDG